MTYSPLGRAFGKLFKDHGIKQIEALKALKPEEDLELESIKGIFSKKMRNTEIKNKVNNIKNGKKILIKKT